MDDLRILELEQIKLFNIVLRKSFNGSNEQHMTLSNKMARLDFS